MKNTIIKSERYAHITLPVYSQEYVYDMKTGGHSRNSKILPPVPNAQSMQIIMPHAHEDIELITVTEGSMRMVNGEREYPLKAGETALISPFVPHTAYIDKACHSYVKYRYFTADCRRLCSAAKQGFLSELASAQFTMTPVLRDNVLHDMVSRMPELYLGQGGDGTAECEILSLFFSVIGRIRTLGGFLDVRKAENPDGDFRQRAMDFINSHYREPITNEQIYEAFPYTQSYFCRLWKKNFGKSFSATLTEYRIAMAIDLYQCGDPSLTIAELAMQVGFTDYSVFCHSFRRIVGETPGEYLKKNGTVRRRTE